MVEQIKKPSAPSNYAKNKVDDQISLTQQTEERWLHSVVITSRLVFNRKSFSTLMAARLPATGPFALAAVRWATGADEKTYGALQGLA